MGIRWKAGIGDPTLVGWITVVAYLMAAALCAAAAMRGDASGRTTATERRFWFWTSFVLLILGINKQLDFQSLLTEVGRVAAKTEGWYGQRRRYQMAFVGAVFIAGVSVLTQLVWRTRSGAPALTLALVGLAFTCTFVVIRAASFHHVGLWLSDSILGLRWNWVIELTGIAIVAISAFCYIVHPYRPR